MFLRRVVIPVLTAAFFSSCAIFEGKSSQHLWVASAQLDDGKHSRLQLETCNSDFQEQVESALCANVDRPSVIWIEPRHTHRVEIHRTHDEELELSSQLSGPPIATLLDGASVPNGSEVIIQGTDLGTAWLNVRMIGGHFGDWIRVPIKGVSARVTVVAWVDGRKINPRQLEAGVSIPTRQQFGSYYRCLDGLVLLDGALPGRSAEFLQSSEDARYIQALLLKGSRNSEPPKTLSEDYITKGDYRLLNDFRITRDDDGNLTAVLSRVEVGWTPDPCRDLGSSKTANALSTVVDWLGSPEHHPAQGQHGGERGDPITQVNQGRIGRRGQRIQGRLANADPSAATPWIWSAIEFDSGARFTLETQVFPTYWVYVDGALQPACSRPQVGLEEFLELDHTSQLTEPRGRR